MCAKQGWTQMKFYLYDGKKKKLSFTGIWVIANIRMIGCISIFMIWIIWEKAIVVQ